MNGLVDRCFGAGALDHIVCADAAGELFDDLNRVLVVDIDDAIGAELRPMGRGGTQPVFTDYSYLAIGCSATFGTTDTTVVNTSMRRIVSVHSVLGLLMNTVVVAVLLSIIVSS